MDSYRDDPERITYFAETDARAKRERFGIKAKDRSKHLYVIGKTGMGKSTLLENMAVQDIQNGEGLAFIDPHGSTAEKLLDYVPQERIRDVVYFAPFDMDNPIAFNVMEDVGYDKRHLVVAGLMAAFKKIWVDAWSARMEYILSNTLLALLEYPDSTLLDVNRMYTDKGFRKKVVENIKDTLVRSFWVDEFATYTDRYTQEATPAIQNKIGQFVSNPLVRNIVGQPVSSFDLREIMDERKIFIANLSKGRIGETNADLLGSMLTTKIYLSAMSRADLPAPQLAKLPNLYFYVDEFQSIANESFTDILSEARKYKLSLIIAHQYIEQMEETVRNAVFGNVGTTVTFRVGPFDAEVLETIFSPQFTAEDLVNLAFAQIYLTLMIDGVGSKPFSAVTLPPIEMPRISYKDQVIMNSQRTYGRPREKVEGAIRERTARVVEERKERPNSGKPPVPRPRGEGQERERKSEERPRSQPRERAQGESERSTPRQTSERKPRKEMTPDELRRRVAEQAHAKESRPRERTQEEESLSSRGRADLRSALADVLSKKEISRDEQAAAARKEKEDRSTPPPSPNEIPEHELRKMLHVDDEK